VRIILKQILKKQSVRMRTWFIWLGRGSSCGLLWTWQWTFRSHRRWGISWMAEWLLASQEGLCSIEFAWCWTNCWNYIVPMWHDKMIMNDVRCGTKWSWPTAVKSQFCVCLRDNGLEQWTEENLKWSTFNNLSTDMW
jgi:hypothetical protein